MSLLPYLSYRRVGPWGLPMRAGNPPGIYKEQQMDPASVSGQEPYHKILTQTDPILLSMEVAYVVLGHIPGDVHLVNVSSGGFQGDSHGFYHRPF